MRDPGLLRLLQLASPALPVGAFSYSEGLEALVDAGRIRDAAALQSWLTQELRLGAMRVEAAVLVRGYGAVQRQDGPDLLRWNRWLSALREAEELRSQSWQMGRSLLRLWSDLEPNGAIDAGDWAWAGPVLTVLQRENCNGAIAFSLVAAHWQIELRAAVLGYLHSWATNLVSAGVKLIPLGQTAGQRLLLHLHPVIESAADAALALPDAELGSCGWGLALASMVHETQYSRLFRS